jgi:UDP-N-acetylglucosamine 2-epimerase (non-hydrolysing)
MLDKIIQLFGIKVDYDLNLMREGQDLYDITSGVLLGYRNILKENQHDLILVHGDTTTAFAATLSAFYQQIPIGHIEAGLRTGNLYSPWPEEANRVLTSRLAKYHFSPTIRNKQTLIDEGIDPQNIIVTGNTVIDALQLMVEKINHSAALREKIFLELDQAHLPVDILKKPYILITGHRRENFGAGFENICRALNQLAQANTSIQFIYPVHLNPNVQEPVNRLLGSLDNIYLIKPLGYESFVYLMKNCYLILTDSGGIQEEAPSLGKPVLVMRDTTERPEAVETGTVKLLGTNVELIVKEVQKLLDNQEDYQKMSKTHNPYGDGKACHRIIEFIRQMKSEK